MRLALYIETSDMRRSTRRMVMPVQDVVRIIWWRLCMEALAYIGLRAISPEHSCALVRWVWYRHLCAAISSRDLLNKRRLSGKYAHGLTAGREGLEL